MQGASWSSSSVRFICHLKCCITAIYSPDSSSTSTSPVQTSSSSATKCLLLSATIPITLLNLSSKLLPSAFFFSPSRSNAPVRGAYFVSTAYSLELHLSKFSFVCLNSAYQLECLVICCHSLQTIDLGVIRISSTCEHIMS